MYIEDKIEEINAVFNNIEIEQRVIVWGAGAHTDALFKYSNILKFPNLVIVDKRLDNNILFGKVVIDSHEISLCKEDVVIISSLIYQSEIENELKTEHHFQGKVIKFYKENEKLEFYKLYSKIDNNRIKYIGNYSNWEEAEKQCSGYGDINILDKVEESTKMVLKGEAAFERDSVPFFEKEFSFHLLAWIELIAIQKRSINILDFGGALGSTYLQNRDFLRKMSVEIKWNIVEQEAFVKRGKKLFEKNEVQFFNSIDEISDDIDIAIFSSVLAYVDNWNEIIEQVLDKKSKYIIIDRTLVSSSERIAVQYVPVCIYPAVYPMRILNEKKVREIFEKSGYRLVHQFHSYVDSDIEFEDMKAISRGFVFEKIKKGKGGYLNENT